MILAFVTVTAVLGNSVARGFSSLFFGLALGMIGIDLQSGQPRFTFGIPELLDGINVILVTVGLFAVGETLYLAAKEPREAIRRFSRALEIDPEQFLSRRGRRRY
jgi:putative tricarboxylic transport membrane protein